MNEAPDFILFLGRFHPLIVHLPIGFLFFAFLLELAGRKKKYESLTLAIPFALFLGFITALVACVLGYFLSLSGDYDPLMLDNHFWFGIITTIIVLLAWLIRTEKILIGKLKGVKANISVLTLVVILLSITGHYGGNLTHGSDYLIKYLPFNKKEKKVLVPVEKLEDAVVFDYLVEPILDNKCTSCHNGSKKKGGLSLVDSLSIMKGGKGGDALIAGNSSKSEIIKRVMLNPEHDDFMPPDGKTPLTDEEITILQYWINNANADFNTKVVAVDTPEDVYHIASSLLGIKGGSKKGTVDLPKVSQIDDSILQDLISEGFNIRELVFDSNVYEAVLPPHNMIKGTKGLRVKLEKLSKIKDNIIWLYIEDNELNDKHMEVIASFTNLQKLIVNRNKITDAGVKLFENHTSLLSLNIYDNKIAKTSLESFSKMKNLQKVYAWQTDITQKELDDYLNYEEFPDVILGSK
ncbi:c-type cytochrome domain-containing protein [Tamlana sp. 2201CG12-4]|uniref:c-type cytochrome domain-containing protein n=1 Tax=Tamlana sp. 2201CG12-4 TaxID=3112582 RepID=UPI002DB664D5|nr:c-type cytochrome domain-containing protein [Tamlana sp. 2201CG12-4]MEC3908514.1 c-type cytochrome domain-containing protein [Tamlana sp. 2201CG12-4]